MSLTSFFPEQFDAIQEFLDTDGAICRRVVIDPEMTEMFLKALARLQEQDDFFHIFLLSEETFQDANVYFRALTHVLNAGFEDAASELPEIEPAMRALQRVEQTDRWPQHFLQLAETFADGLPDECGCLAFVLAPEDITDPQQYAKSVAFLAMQTQCDWLKFIALDPRQAPALEEISGTPGLSSQTFYLAPKEIEQRISEDIKSNRVTGQERRQYLGMKAGFCVANGDVVGGGRLQRQALDEMPSDADPGERAAALYNFGTTCAKAGRHERAVQVLCESADLCVAHKNAALGPFVYINLSASLHKLGDFAQAYASLRVARDMFKGMGHIPGEAHVCDQLGELYKADGDTKRARQSWTYAHTLYGRLEAEHFADLKQVGQEGMEAKLASINAAPETESAVS